MDNTKTKKWIRAIALWFFLYAIFTLFYYILAQFSIIDSHFSKGDQFQAILSCLGNLILFLGLWKFSSWGWKATIILIPISWIYNIYSVFNDYKEGMGIVLFFFALIDASILNFLFKKKVRDIFKISSNLWININWVVLLIYAIAIFFLTKDLFGDITAIIIVLAVLLASNQINKIKKENTRNMKNINKGECPVGENDLKV